MDPRFNGPQGGGGFDPNGPFQPGYGGPVFHRALGGEHVIAGIVLLVLVMLILVLVFFLLYRLLRQPSGGWSPHAAAIRELEMRYARGEIGRDDFLQRRADLLAPATTSNLPPPAPPAGGEAPPNPPPRGEQAASS
jgi:putative membrane protein